MSVSTPSRMIRLDTDDPQAPTTLPPLPNGVLAVVKRECETCRTIFPVLEQLDAAFDLTVYTQEERGFPHSPTPIDDTGLAMGWHHEIEAVPTLVRVVNGVETGRTVGWSCVEWGRSPA